MLATATVTLKRFAPRLTGALRETRDRLVPGKLLLRDLIAAEARIGTLQQTAMNDSNRLHASIAMENLATLTLRIGRMNDAWSRYREAFGLYVSVDDAQGMISSLAGLTLSSQSTEHLRLAAALLGYLATLPASDEQFDIPDLSAKERELRAELGDVCFQTAWEEGRRLTVPEVIDRLAVVARGAVDYARR